MTLLDAKEYDPAPERRRIVLIVGIIVAVVVLAAVAYHLRYYPERHRVDKFFAAVQSKEYESAYGLWLNDPDWKQHTGKYSVYSFNDFYRDWGTGGEWGIIKSYTVDCSASPSGGSGVIVQVTVNGRSEHAYVWVEKASKVLSFSPDQLDCGNWFGRLTE